MFKKLSFILIVILFFCGCQSKEEKLVESFEKYRKTLSIRKDYSSPEAYEIEKRYLETIIILDKDTELSKKYGGKPYLNELSKEMEEYNTKKLLAMLSSSHDISPYQCLFEKYTDSGREKEKELLSIKFFSDPQIEDVYKYTSQNFLSCIVKYNLREDKNVGIKHIKIALKKNKPSFWALNSSLLSEFLTQFKEVIWEFAIEESNNINMKNYNFTEAFKNKTYGTELKISNQQMMRIKELTDGIWSFEGKPEKLIYFNNGIGVHLYHDNSSLIGKIRYKILPRENKLSIITIVRRGDDGSYYSQFSTDITTNDKFIIIYDNNNIPIKLYKSDLSRKT